MLNPIGFRPGVVSFWTTVVYLALLIPLVILNETVGPAPEEAPYRGVSLTEAWLDLTTLTRSYHPYDSRSNEEVRDWLLLRIRQILDGSGVSWTTETIGLGQKQWEQSEAAATDVVVFNDMGSNVTFINDLLIRDTGANHDGAGQQATYFEGTNIYVYIRGVEDEEGPWWKSSNFRNPIRNSRGGTMVNAHYDSVSTGYGATDDGIGVVTILQLIKYFTQPGNQPTRGILAVLNNGEELGLNGARAAGQTPLVGFVHTFMNLEGAGGGGRALLFRTSDQEVTAAYAKTPAPFGTVVGSDLFGLGMIKSATDYSIWKDIYGQRGLDLAFYKPRARYHTREDDVKHASRESIWHMLSAAIHTMSSLSGDTGDTFVGPRPDGDPSKIASGSGSNAVWFDLFGQSFVLFNLRGMFAWSLVILIAAPLILLFVSALLYKFDKYYFFCSSVRVYEQPDYEHVTIGGWKGLFRFPIAVVFASALLAGSALLMNKVNPFIIHSSPYSVWAMMFSLFYFALWVIMRGANFIRPSALHRGYVHVWMFVFGWALLVAATVLEDRFHVGAVYPLVFFQSAVFLSTLITLCELFGLPKKALWGQQVREDHEARDHHYRPISRNEDLIAPTPGETLSPAPTGHQNDERLEEEAEPASETTPLVGGNGAGENTRTTFTTTYRRSISALVHGARKAAETGGEPFEYEQPWSGHLPSWVWWFQFLILGPFTIILSAQLGLVLVDSVRQTGADGSELLFPYILVCFFTILLLLPITPFIHRVTYHIPVLLLAVFVGTLLYNLIAFPFSADSKYKAFFQQTVDLDTGATAVHVHGVEEYVRLLIADLPSASGREVDCVPSRKSLLFDCSYDGSSVPPRLGSRPPVGVPPQRGYADLVTINATRGEGSSARIEIDAVDTKGCALDFGKAVSEFEVEGGSGWDNRFGLYPNDGISLVKLWRRDWQTKWVVNVKWAGDNVSAASTGPTANSGDEQPLETELEPAVPSREDELKARDTSGLDGSVTCMWNDLNTAGTIPAYEEVLKFAPTWVIWTNTGEGLVEGSKSFKV